MKRLVGTTLCICLLLAVSGSAQSLDTAFTNSKGLNAFGLRIPTNFEFTGTGARAQGMGNAYLAVSNDVSAVSWNPAGLFGQDKPVLGVSYGAFSPSGKFDLTSTISPTGQVYERDKTFGGLTQLSFLAPVRIKGHPFVMAASYSRSGSEYDFFNLQFDTLTTGFNDQGVVYFPPIQASTRSEYHSTLDVINAGFGTRVSSKVSVGAAVNVYTNESTSELVDAFVIDSFFIGSGQQRQAQRIEGSTSILDTSKYSGVNFTLGLKAELEKIALALTVKTPFTLQQKTNRTVFVVQTANGVELTGITDTIHFDRIVSKLDIPLLIAAGVSVNPNDKITWATDVELQRFSGGKIRLRDSLKIIPGDKDQEFFTEFDPKWNNQWSIRTGFEYVYDTKHDFISEIPLRFGFSYGQTSATFFANRIDRFGYGSIPIPVDSTRDTVFVDSTKANNSAVTQWSFSLGAGVRFQQIHLDFAYSYISENRDHYPTYGSQTTSGVLEKRSNNFSVSFTGFF